MQFSYSPFLVEEVASVISIRLLERIQPWWSLSDGDERQSLFLECEIRASCLS